MDMSRDYLSPQAELLYLPKGISLLEPTSASGGFEDVQPGEALNGDEPGLDL